LILLTSSKAAILQSTTPNLPNSAFAWLNTFQKHAIRLIILIIYTIRYLVVNIICFSIYTDLVKVVYRKSVLLYKRKDQISQRKVHLLTTEGCRLYNLISANQYLLQHFAIEKYAQYLGCYETIICSKRNTSSTNYSAAAAAAQETLLI
jgi:hypothetical protein